MFVGGSYGLSWLIQQSIAGYDWNYYALDLHRENHFSEPYINEAARTATDFYFQEVDIDVRPPDLLDMNANLGGLIRLHLPVTLRQENDKPYFSLTEINDLPLYMVTDNISQGLNRGIDRMFEKAPINLTSLQVEEDGIVFEIEKSDRAAWSPPPTPVATPVPTVTPTPDGLALVGIFNELDRAVTLEIEDETVVIAAHDTKVIEKIPGTYRYTVRYTNGQIAAQGTKTWGFKAYKWRINLNQKNED